MREVAGATTLRKRELELQKYLCCQGCVRMGACTRMATAAHGLVGKWHRGALVELDNKSSQ